MDASKVECRMQQDNAIVLQITVLQMEETASRKRVTGEGTELT